MIRVDHAGEYGAVRIYAGQKAVFGARNSKAADAIRHMAAQEDEHLARFDALIAERGVRPTVLQPVWHAAGFALGAATALLGEHTAMACTEAVEEVIDDHYAHQIAVLGDSDPELKTAIEKFRADEIAHRDAALAHGSEQALGHTLLTSAIKQGCKLAIALSTKI
ncbi:demethoxyubiquinone hydroxylase family protein [Rhizomicrobium electricum]|uniref:3-demethoxyubiquinol 3-hydroxylase n=1 Tax=Rhizomicrobium electricum TaxID=480070 RepID=A0ABP3QIU8_9PROT|nr:demethoxyubiquinone hydroxylase family protein [Rhizomicrobium electricum]NIJ49136.1 ubiquinone biosynthesis monooxygenase Coq7 [Rhizomicrobium electricum]